MKIELFLDGNPVEINKDIDFVLNKQFTELTDLTSIIVDYTKTVKVPMTPRNNELFNYVYKLEHQVLMNEDIISYDPSQKINMTMTFNGSIVMDGYAVLNSVNLNEKVYEINLYGQLGSIFSSLKEKVLDEYLNGINGWWKTIKMNAQTIVTSFRNAGHSLDWSSENWYDFFGFAPQVIGKNDNFNTSGYEEYGTGEVKNFVDVINTTRNITYADIYVKDGLDFNQYAEIRSYMTRPYVYVDKIIQLVQNEINNGDFNGYTMTLDPDWFNSTNPYYNNLCFFPGNESIIDSGEGVNGLVTWDNSERYMNWPMTYRPSTSTVDLEGYTYNEGNNGLITISSSSGEASVTLSLNGDGVVVRDRVNGVGSTSGFNSNGKWAYYNLDNINQIPVRYIGVYDSNDVLINKLYLVDDKVHSVHKDKAFLHYEWSHTELSGVWNKLKKLNSKNIVPNSCKWINGSSDNNYCEVTQIYNFGNDVLNTNSFKFKVGCDLINLSSGTMVRENISHSEYKPLCPFKNSKYKNEVWKNGATWVSYFRPIQSMNVSSNTYRSGSYWTIKDILGREFNPFKWLIDYVKKFRLAFDIDYMTRTINLKAGYFNNITYKEITVDYGKDVMIEPVINKYNKVNYGYKSNNSKKGTKYYKNNGVEYGDFDINTLINLNNESLSLTPDKDESVFIPEDMKCLYWANLNSTQSIRYYNPILTNKVINTLNKDGEIEYYPFFAFRLNNLYNHIQPNVPFYFISDDTPNQKNNGEYTYLEHSSGWISDGYLIGLNIIPQFDNYISKTVSLKSIIVPTAMSVEDNEIPKPVTKGDAPGSDETTTDEIVTIEYTDPVTGQKKVIRRPMASGSTVEEETQDFLYWTTFGVPKEVYNGYLPSNIDNYSIYNRWKNYLNEIFNVHNKKVTCYVRMTYPDFINFKFNQLFVIDNCVFLVNKIIDFNPNSTEPTKVELIQISDVNNLK